MSCPLCDRVVDTKNKKYDYLIHEFKHSFLYLGEHQYYQGYCVLVAKEHYKEMTDLHEDTQVGLFQEMMRTHSIIEKVFNPKKMNMCSLGNVVPHVHWHFFPRYENDPDFKNPPWLQMHEFESARLASSDRDKLIEILKKHF